MACFEKKWKTTKNQNIPPMLLLKTEQITHFRTQLLSTKLVKTAVSYQW